MVHEIPKTTPSLMKFRDFRGAALRVAMLSTLALSAACMREPGFPEVPKEQVRDGKGDPPPDCAELGTVSGSDRSSLDDARQDLREEAGKKGATYVRIDLVGGSAGRFGGGFEVNGTAFRCPAVRTTSAPVKESLVPGAGTN